MTFKAFITGTDTEVGKTFVTTWLLKHYARQGFSTLGLKPIASGAERIDGQLRNDDALQLQRASTYQLSYDVINPFCFGPPIAPHLAAEQVGRPLTRSQVIASLQLSHAVDVCLVEGAGGWLLPLNQDTLLPELIQHFNLPVILVVGMRLGCINHALLSVQAIQASLSPLLGWIANNLDPNIRMLDENIETLRRLIPVPCLGIVPHCHQETEQSCFNNTSESPL